ncbi:MAG: VWA domain-containing protein [Deltaproteobacteria bacterium]|nr:VWA domain-containing protein [Deltaproteobacteria bacterium]
MQNKKWLWVIASLFLFAFACSSEEKSTAKKEKTGEKIQVSAPPLTLKETKTDKITTKDVSIQPMPETELAPSPPNLPVGTATGTTQAPTKEIPSIPFQPTVVQNPLSVELILDASGSMNGLLGTESKWSVAKQMVEQLSLQWQGQNLREMQLGLRVFGSLSPLEANNCQDSQLIYPLQPTEKVSFAQSFANVAPQGNSSLAYAMEESAKDFTGQQEDRVIILIVDGKDTCGGDPCATASKLFTGLGNVITHVIGFDVTSEDETALQCIAEKGRGVYFRARTREELASAINESLQSTTPYNLKIKTLVGASPIPTTITVFKANTQEVLKTEASLGIELLRLPAGSYDILVEYTNSIARTKPSKIIKGVELTESGKIEQEVRFDLASLTLSARDAKGNPAPVEYKIFTEAGTEPIATTQSNGEETTYFIDPGVVDVVARSTAPTAQEMVLKEPHLTLDREQGMTKHFAFQTGALVLKGENSINEPVPFAYRVTRQGESAATILSGEFQANGGTIDLPPGQYDIFITGNDPSLTVQATGLLPEIKVEGGSIQELKAVLITGLLKIQATKADGKKTPSKITILSSVDKREFGILNAADGTTVISLPPGKYDILGSIISPIYATNPIAKLEGIEIEKGKTTEQTLVYNLGTIKLLGRSAKERLVNTFYTVYDEADYKVVATAGPQAGWIQFDLPPGHYSIKGVDADAESDPQPTVWQKEVQLTAKDTVAREMVFTNAKLRLIGRGTNHEIISVTFKLYEYGHDRPLLSGTTGDDWEAFDLVPGHYYIEASFHDKVTAQVLKKWVTLKVEENQLVEKELRF